MTPPARLLASLALATVLAASPVLAQPLDPDRVPAPLRPWTDWVLHGEEAARCPFLDGQPAETRCAWPARLGLVLEGRGGTFVQEWFLHAQASVPLLGDGRAWPEDVRVNGAPAPVVPRGGVPSLRLAPGRRTVEGRFVWSTLPDSLQVPPETGLLALTLSGREVAFPNRDDQGRLWLAGAAAPAQAEDRLEARVHRRVVDDVPLVLVTRVELEVSGRNREVVLGPALPGRFVPMRLETRLPARLEPDGRLRVQVRPGTWTIEATARHEGPAAALAPGATAAPWPGREVWAFEARPALRVVAVEGVPAVDPAQTTLPDAWKSLPAFRVDRGETMRLVEKRRGDADPAPDRLSLARTLWLDFDGGGLSVRDEITGTMRRGWRLEMRPPAALGRVAVDGRDQPITRVGPSGDPGVEVRQGELHVTADSRSPARGRLPAAGWAHPFQEVHGTLHLPPGWRLFAVGGADDVGETWVSSWSLLDLFLVLVVAMAVRRLYGPRWAVVALVTLGLTLPEPGAPGWLWLAVLAGEALRRLAGESRRIRAAMQTYRAAALVLLVLVAVPFLVLQVRGAIYPVLEGPRAGLDEVAPGAGLAGPAPAEPSSAPLGELSRDRAVTAKVGQYAAGDSYGVDPKAVVQTGPGLPGWTWRAVRLGFRGPVDPDQTVRLWLISPALGVLLTMARVALVALLLLRLLGVPAGRLPAALRPALGAVVLAAAALLGAEAARADTPSPEILAELKRRLLERPACLPSCASVSRLDLAAAGLALRARLEVAAEAPTAVPLPGGLAHWSPERVLVDGAPARGLLRGAGGTLWLDVPPGVHQVVLEGRLPDRDAVQLPLPLRPRRVTVRADGWTVEGVGEDGTADDALRLSRRRPGPGPEGTRLTAEALPPFLLVERTLRLGLTWAVETRVQRLTPIGAAVVMEVPLLDGESVTTPGVRVTAGRAVVAMAPQAQDARWRSTLAIGPSVRLVAPATSDWTEAWRLDTSPVWHVDATGVPPVHAETAGARVPEWRPWPGESVVVAVARPEPVPGQTLTIDASRLVVRPGARTTEAELTVRLRSSRGGEHVFTLPEGAELLAVSIDGAARPLRLDGRALTVPVVPGGQDVEVAWRQARGMAGWFRGLDVGLGAPGVNAAVEVHLPADRWLLATGGPRVGPAVLFWGFLVVLAMVAAGLGRLGTTPLGFRHWLLLGVGLSQVSAAAAAVVVGWFLALGWRARRGAEVRSWQVFDAVQVGLVFWTAVALAVVVWSVRQGLLGHPDMQVAGNGSSRFLLRWFQDRTGETLPRPWVLSVPLLVYRAAMLAWALWLATSLIAWLRWAWTCLASGGLWRRAPRLAPEA